MGGWSLVRANVLGRVQAKFAKFGELGCHLKVVGFVLKVPLALVWFSTSILSISTKSYANAGKSSQSGLVGGVEWMLHGHSLTCYCWLYVRAKNRILLLMLYEHEVCGLNCRRFFIIAVLTCPMCIRMMCNFCFQYILRPNLAFSSGMEICNGDLQTSMCCIVCSLADFSSSPY